MVEEERNAVLAIGDAAFDESPFIRRRLILVRAIADAAAGQFNSARAVLLCEPMTRPGSIKKCFESIFPAASNYGLWCGALAKTLEEQAQIDAIRKDVAGGEEFPIVQEAKLDDTAEDIARWQMGPPAGAAKIEPATVALDEEQRLLLRRAFSDCSEVFLESFPGGKASLFVFRAHASLANYVVGPRPLPFFLKIASPKEIETEKGKYRDYAENYVPFNLRPNLDRRRCVQTRNTAALVGNFVEDAVSLRACLQSGQSGALFALFETSLKGFRLQPFAAGEARHKDFLAGFVRERIWIEELSKKDKVINRAKARGLVAEPASVEQKLYRAAERISCFVAPYHGDLHAGNVMVRGQDAILIDFSSAAKGPLTADPAALEASLIFGTDKFDAPDSFLEWRAFVDEMYGSAETLRPPSLFGSRPTPYSWLRRALRELRHVLLACEADAEEAKIVLATYLMRYARLDVEGLPTDELRELALWRHAYALVIAERIVNGLGGEAKGVV
jgi:hypothetical protein